jgi:hypothetical protein
VIFEREAVLLKAVHRAANRGKWDKANVLFAAARRAAFVLVFRSLRADGTLARDAERAKREGSVFAPGARS